MLYFSAHGLSLAGAAQAGTSQKLAITKHMLPVKWPIFWNLLRGNPKVALPQLPVEPSIYHAVARAAVALADTISAKVIVAFTTSGNTAVLTALERPQIPLLLITPSAGVQRRLTLLWGKQSSPNQLTSDYEAAISKAVNAVQALKMAVSVDHILIISCMPFGVSDTKNSTGVVSLQA